MQLPRIVASLTLSLFIPTALYAQASIAGTVRDTSGAVLPGVTVEAASPALIEKVRSAVTDGTGVYRIENVRPGTYALTFTLTGFSTVRHEGIELTGSFTATVNAEMSVGAVEQRITVTGEAPIVDVQNAREQTVVNKDVIAALPTSGGYSSLLALVPGIVGGTFNVQIGPCACTFSAHGAILAGRANAEGRTFLDGLLISVPQGSSSNYMVDTRDAQELSFTVSGSLGEVETGGPVLNIVPRTGGNTVSGSLYAGVGPQWLEGSNYTQELQQAGLTAPTPFTKNYDYSGAAGGPIRKDRLWFFGSVRAQGNSQGIANLYYNLNAGDPNAWLYKPDLTRPAFRDQTWDNANLRLTAQLTPRNKLNLFWDEQRTCSSCENGSTSAGSTTTPEASSTGVQPISVRQITWSSVASSKLLVEVGAGEYLSHWGGFIQKQDPYTGNLVQVVEQCSAGCPANGNIAGLTYRSQSNSVFQASRNMNETFTWRAVASYVTGARSFKAGYVANLIGAPVLENVAPNDLTFQFNNGVPNQLTMFINNFPVDTWMRGDGLFAQEQWTLRRLTLQGAVRYDRSWSWAQPQQVGPAQFQPVPLVFPKTPIVNAYNDLTPRMSATYDLFGNGKTALKAMLGKYLEAAQSGSNYPLGNPTSRIPMSVSRSWTDANGNFVPDCNLLNPSAQDLRASGGDFCGALSNSNFGTSVFSNTIDPALLKGWGVRPSDWDLSLSIQHEVLPRTSVDVGYTWRWFQGFTVTDNLAVNPSDFTPFSVTAPLDPRLPNGGGYTVSGLYNVIPALFGKTNNFVTSANNYGGEYVHFNGLDISINARPTSSVTIQGGFNDGQTTADSCAIRAAVPETAPLNPYCHVVTGYLPHLKLFGSYIIPKVDVQLGVTFTSKPGIQENAVAGTPTITGGELDANYTVSNAVVSQSLGRNLSGNAPNVTVNLIQPGTLYGARVNELDLRVAKILNFRQKRATVSADIYNLLNSSAVLTYNQAFIPSGTWLTPTGVMQARFAKVNVRFDF